MTGCSSASPVGSRARAWVCCAPWATPDQPSQRDRFPGRVSGWGTRWRRDEAYRVPLHCFSGETHARLPQALVACAVGEHLRAARLFRVFDFVDASFLAVQRSAGHEILFVGKYVGDVGGDFLQRASCCYGFRRLSIPGLSRWRVDGSRCQITESAARGCVVCALLGCHVCPVRRGGAHVVVAATWRIPRRVEMRRVGGSRLRGFW